MKIFKAWFLIFSLFILFGCNNAENNDRNSLKTLSIDWKWKLVQIGEYYRLINASLNHDKDRAYFQGVHDAVSIVNSNSDLYDRVDDYIIANFADHFSEPDGRKLENILSRLDSVTWEVNELIVSDQISNINKQEFSALIIAVADDLDVSGAATYDLTLTNVIGNPLAVLRKHSKPDVLTLIDNFENDLKNLEVFINKHKPFNPVD